MRILSVTVDPEHETYIISFVDTQMLACEKSENLWKHFDKMNIKYKETEQNRNWYPTFFVVDNVDDYHIMLVFV